MQILTSKQQLKVCFDSMSFEIVWFCYKLYHIILFHVSETIYMYLSLKKMINTFLKISIFCFQLPQNVTSTDDCLGINGVRLAHSVSLVRMVIYPFSVFFETVLGRKHSGKVSKNCLATFILRNYLYRWCFLALNVNNQLFNISVKVCY